MELIKSLIDFVLHIDVHLVEIVNNYQAWTYLILFFIIFADRQKGASWARLHRGCRARKNGTACLSRE